MPRLKLIIGGIVIHAELSDTLTAAALLAASPFSGTAMTWGQEVYFATPVRIPRQPGARSMVQPGELAFWPDGSAIATGFGPTPISRDREIRLASPSNVWARALDDVRKLRTVQAGAPITVERVE
jgi:hypothetical protein